MTYLAAASVVLIFVTALEWLGVTRVAAAAVEDSRGAARTMADRSLGDLEKERALRAASLGLFGRFLSIGVRSVGALVLSLLPLLAFDLLGLAEIETTTAWLSSWVGMIWMSVLVVIYLLVRQLR
jgi:hypothetical protein